MNTKNKHVITDNHRQQDLWVNDLRMLCDLYLGIVPRGERERHSGELILNDTVPIFLEDITIVDNIIIKGDASKKFGDYEKNIPRTRYDNLSSLLTLMEKPYESIKSKYPRSPIYISDSIINTMPRVEEDKRISFAIRDMNQEDGWLRNEIGRVHIRPILASTNELVTPNIIDKYLKLK